MEKTTIQEVVNDIKAKRDALSLAHEQLKKDNDDWNKCIIVLSLMNGMFESIKIKMNWNNNIVALVPHLPCRPSSPLYQLSSNSKSFPNKWKLSFNRRLY